MSEPDPIEDRRIPDRAGALIDDVLTLLNAKEREILDFGGGDKLADCLHRGCVTLTDNLDKKTS